MTLQHVYTPFGWAFLGRICFPFHSILHMNLNAGKVCSKCRSMEQWPLPFAEDSIYVITFFHPLLGTSQKYGECYPVMRETSGALCG